jgi:hypothetical protein
MNRRFILASDQVQLDAATKLMAEGWEIAPEYEGKPIRLEWSLVFPLVLYESEEERPQPVEEERKAGEFDDVEDVKSAEFTEVAELKKQGWTVQSLYAKNVLMIKRGKEILQKTVEAA